MGYTFPRPGEMTSRLLFQVFRALSATLVLYVVTAPSQINGQVSDPSLTTALRRLETAVESTASAIARVDVEKLDLKDSPRDLLLKRKAGALAYTNLVRRNIAALNQRVTMARLLLLMDALAGLQRDIQGLVYVLERMDTYLESSRFAEVETWIEMIHRRTLDDLSPAVVAFTEEAQSAARIADHALERNSLQR